MNKETEIIPMHSGQPEITNNMKMSSHGYYSFTVEESCPKCALELDKLYGDDIKCLCDGADDHIYSRKIEVPWTTCKEIYKGMALAAIESIK